MGGQACILYGAAEFSRDLDLLILSDPDSLERLQSALTFLKAEKIALPVFEAGYLERGHAVHFRCHGSDAPGLRIDVMSTLRGVASFDELWERRTSIETEGEVIEVLSLGDLVLAKKTQRDKDWPMIRRLVEQSFFSRVNEETPAVEFWLSELRTPELLIQVAKEHAGMARIAAEKRPAIKAALDGDALETAHLLAIEEQEERRKDREYWEPLRRELEQLRRSRRG
jgi:hypothetical protein